MLHSIRVSTTTLRYDLNFESLNLQVNLVHFWIGILICDFIIVRYKCKPIICFSKNDDPNNGCYGYNRYLHRWINGRLVIEPFYWQVTEELDIWLANEYWIINSDALMCYY